MLRTPVIIIAAAATLAACGKTAERRDIQKLVDEQWRSCFIVEPKNIKIESQDRKTVRYSYVLRMRSDGIWAGKSIPCPMPAQKMVEALFNKDMADLKVDNETTVTQEATKQ